MDKESNGLWELMKKFENPIKGEFSIDILKREYSEFTRYKPENPTPPVGYAPQYGTPEEQEQQRKELSEKLGGIRILTNEEFREENTL